MTDTKITKAMVLTAIKEIVAEDVEIPVGDVSVKGTDIIEYCDISMAQIEAKAEKARERAAKNKAVGDELRAEVLAHVTDEFQTADDITEQIEGFDDITKAKVIARLTQLVKTGDIIKEQCKVDSRKVMCYALASAAITDSEEE